MDFPHNQWIKVVVDINQWGPIPRNTGPTSLTWNVKLVSAFIDWLIDLWVDVLIFLVENGWRFVLPEKKKSEFDIWHEIQNFQEHPVTLHVIKRG